VCGACRSINEGRGGRCYKCRTPRELVGAGSAPAPEAPSRGVGTYASSAGHALTAQLLIGLTIVAAIVSSALGANLFDRLLDGTLSEGDTLTVAIVGLAALAIAAAALVAWSLWLSRVVANIPAIGGGWTNVTPAAAFYENFIPGLNVLRVPAILRDVMTRLDPARRGEPLIVAAWLGLVGGLVLPRAARWFLAFVVDSPEGLARLSIVVGQVALGLTVVGAGFLIAIVRWVETRMAERAATPAPAAAASD
jgi:hypothetical protein